MPTIVITSFQTDRLDRSLILCARHILSCKNIFPLLLIQEELVVSYWQKNGHFILGHFILVNYLREACPGTVWLSN